MAEFSGQVTPSLEADRATSKGPQYDPLRPLPIGQIAGLLDRLRRTRSDVPMEWRVGEYLAVNSIDLVTARALGSRNIGEALGIAHRHQHIQTNVRSFTLRSAASGTVTEVHQTAADDPDMRFVFQSLLAAKIWLLFHFYQGSDKQHQIDRRANSLGRLLARFAEELDFIDIDFRDDEVVLNLHRNLLAQGLPDMGERQRNACDQLLQRKSVGVTCQMQWADRIRAHIRSSNFAEISVRDICDAFRIQQRTLARLLRDEGTSFTAILSELRREKALHLVGNTGLPLKRVAAELGFNSDASFSMAFKSWTGETPMRFRKAGSGRNQAMGDRTIALVSATAGSWPSCQIGGLKPPGPLGPRWTCMTGERPIAVALR